MRPLAGIDLVDGVIRVAEDDERVIGRGRVRRRRDRTEDHREKGESEGRAWRHAHTHLLWRSERGERRDFRRPPVVTAQEGCRPRQPALLIRYEPSSKRSR